MHHCVADVLTLSAGSICVHRRHTSARSASVTTVPVLPGSRVTPIYQESMLCPPRAIKCDSPGQECRGIVRVAEVSLPRRVDADEHTAIRPQLPVVGQCARAEAGRVHKNVEVRRFLETQLI